jgi:AcrR family transcriptional regulator
MSTKKSEQTRQRIIDTFLSFYAQRPFEQITIKSITERLDINRGTFYLHYLDMDDLLTSLEDKHLQAISTISQAHRSAYLSSNVNDIKDFMTAVLDYIDANRDEIRVLVGLHSRSRFKNRLKDIMRTNARVKCETVLKGYRWNEYGKYVIESLVAGNVGIICDWVTEDGDRRRADEVADSLADILLHLPYTNLEH